MPQFKKDVVSRALLAKLYESLTAQPDIDEISDKVLPEDHFIAWCQPGLPFLPQDFTFATRGIGGGTGAGEEVRQRILRADDWSRLVNFIPNPSGIYDESQQRRMFDTTAFAQDGSSIAAIYENVLRFSEVAASDLTDDQKARLERFRGLMIEVREEEDILTGAMHEVIDDSRLIKAYNTFMGEYIDAALLYNNRRLNALNSEDAAAVQDWALNAQLYRQKVRSAFSKWVSAGKKNEVEAMRAFIDQTTMRNLALLKADLLDNLERAHLNNPVSGADFLWTSLIPAALPQADGWTGSYFRESETTRHEEKHTNQWEGNVSIPVYSWLIKPSGSGKSEKFEKQVDTSNFKIEFEIAQAMISRPWFSPEFLFSNAWRFAPNMPDLTNMTESLSNGEEPPAGSMIAYPTAAIFVRNVVLDFDELHETTSSFTREISAGLNVSIGPFKIGGGKYTRGDQEFDFHSEMTAQGLKIPGMQLIGFKCKLLPKLPNPSPNVETWE